MARCIMVQGTMSGAGKSLLATALCRIFRQDGLRVAPFKSQNMALNSYITRDGLEMGRAQVAQAEAAGREPDVRMNPVLLKPSSDTGSQLIVNGEVRGQYRAAEYFKMKKSLVPEILRAYESLAAEFSRTLEDLEKITGYTYPAVYIFGGGSKDSFLCQLTADATGRTVVAGPTEATAIGNAMSTLIALGEIKDVAEARTVVRRGAEVKEFLPNLADGDGRR